VQCDGLSLLTPVRRGQFPGNWRQEAHWEFDFRNVPAGEHMETELGLTQHQCTLNVVRGTEYKYVHFTNMPPLFFDLTNDPGELTDQAGNPEYLPRVLEYAQKMLSWRMNHEDNTLSGMRVGPGGVTEVREARY